MKIEELQRKHQDIYVEDDLKEEFRQHRNLSIEFAMQLLKEMQGSITMDYEVYKEDIDQCDNCESIIEFIDNKIEELKNLIKDK